MDENLVDFFILFYYMLGYVRIWNTFVSWTFTVSDYSMPWVCNRKGQAVAKWMG